MTIGDDWQVSIVYDFQRDKEVLRIVRSLENGKREYLCPNGDLVTHEVNDVILSETMWPLPTQSLGALMDALWERGIRPKDRRHEEEAKLLRESLDRSRGLLDLVLPAALRKQA